MNKMAAKNKKQSFLLKKIIIILSVLLALVLTGVILFFMNHITQVEIDGNNFYTDEQIKELVINGELEENAWYLYWKYKYSEPPAIPFIDKVEVELAGRGSIKLHIYEKSIVGYVEYLGKCMYFDKDGTVVETSAEPMEGIPRITGLRFERITLYEKLPVGKEEVFQAILNLTKELKKNQIMPDKIQFNDELEAILYFGQAQVLFGTDSSLNEKVARLKALVPQLDGRSGVLHMEEVDEDNRNIIFRQAEE